MMVVNYKILSIDPFHFFSDGNPFTQMLAGKCTNTNLLCIYKSIIIHDVKIIYDFC